MSHRQVRKFVETATIIAALSLTLTGYSVAASDMFLKIDGIKGECVDSKHKDEIDILSWSWGVSQSGSAHIGGGGGSGKANVQDVTFTKYVDRSSPLLLKNSVTGTHISEVNLTVRKAGVGQNEYLKLRLEDCLISSVSTGGSETQDKLTENVSVNFSKYTLEYVPQKRDGSSDTSIKTTYDVKTNKAY